MTVLATHPATEELARFIEGTLEDPARAGVVDHIADCDDCRITVVDVTAFGELEVKPLRVAGPRWWVGTAAAAAVAITIGGAFFVHERRLNERRDLLAPLIKESTDLASRLVDARLSGFPHVARKKIPRGSSGDVDQNSYALQAEAEKLLQRSGDDPGTQHAKGVAGLLLAQARLADLTEDNDETRQERKDLVAERKKAVTLLESAATRASNNAAYQADLAVGLIATREAAKALDACNRALQIEPRNAEAIFNRAQALELLDRIPEAIAEYRHYLTVDGSSTWAKEVRERIHQLTLYNEPQ
jgi:tetratricopeptide (TPR) repeat protein